MRDYQAAYEASGHRLPAKHEALAHWFDAMQAGERLPPRAVQAVQAGLVAHALTDPKVDPEAYRYYQWVQAYLRAEGYQWQELSAQLIGMAFVSCHVFKTDLPQPLTLNPCRRWP